MQGKQKDKEEDVELDEDLASEEIVRLDEDLASEEIVDETVVLTETELTDNVGDVSVEINVEELVAKVEAEQDDDAKRKKEIRQKLEEIAEEKGFEETYAIEYDDD